MIHNFYDQNSTHDYPQSDVTTVELDNAWKRHFASRKQEPWTSLAPVIEEWTKKWKVTAAVA